MSAPCSPDALEEAVSAALDRIAVRYGADALDVASAALNETCARLAANGGAALAVADLAALADSYRRLAALEAQARLRWAEATNQTGADR